MAIWQGNMPKSLKYGMAWKYVKEINVETHNIIDDDVPYWDKVIFQNHHLYKKNFPYTIFISLYRKGIDIITAKPLI